ncbi:hypothetical protein V1512DRAFT_231844 [Lipomyces arxii]|uniref:uncharacterized protein n=1 Tax=Lipomyces arxii TaxID=56418 RepID=UPI0034CF5E3B
MIKLKLRLPSSATEIVTFEDDAVIGELVAKLLSFNELADTEFQVKVGFPPKQIDLSNEGVFLTESVRSGDQLTVTAMSTVSSALPADIMKMADSFGSSVQAPSLAKRETSDDKRPPEAQCGPESVVVLRVMEDDNSCLFRAIGYSILHNLDTMHELRSLVASAIVEDPIEYSDAVLGRPRAQYCEWITRDNSWGGAIEISILANHFDITINSIDVATGRVDSFNPGKPTFIVVIYSGIHYDSLALAPAGVEGMAEFDQTVFDSGLIGDQVMASAEDLVGQLKKKHYYTDTASFSIRCNVCGQVLKGQKQTQSHSNSTGHTSFQEVNS